MGRVIRFHYGGSGAEQRRDREQGREWCIPQHRQVVKKIEVIDSETGEGTATSFDYRDGHYDGGERHFVAFAQVDTVDVDLAKAPTETTVPTLTRRFYHRGDDQDRGQHRYAVAGTEPPSSAPSSLSWPDPDHADAHRALAGKLVRTEVYAYGREHPLRVEDTAYRVERLLPSVDEHSHGAFRVLAIEERESVLEQQPEDPRIVRRLALEHDEHGYVRLSAEVALARRGAPELEGQGRVHAVATRARFAHVDTPEHFELGLPVEAEQLELELSSAAVKAQVIRDALSSARTLSRRRTLYWDETHTTALPLGRAASPVRVHHEEEAVFSHDELARLFARFGDPETLARNAGYAREGELWWRSGPVQHYGRFGLLASVVRSDGAERRFEYAHDFVLNAVVDEGGNRTEAEIDWRVFAPWRIRDPNGFVREARYDARGIPVRVTAYGTVDGEPYGHEPLGTEADPSFDEALADPEGTIGGSAQVYAYELGASPRAVVLTAERFARGPPQVRVEVTYYDSFGRVLQHKERVEGEEHTSAPRWRTSGLHRYNEKQEPIREHEPFLSSTSALEIVEQGVATTLHYDALGRVVREAYPNGTHSRTTHEPWRVASYDANDTILEPEAIRYRLGREERDPKDPEYIALERALAHADTPSVMHFDPFGRTIATDELADDRSVLRTRSVLDGRGDPMRLIDARTIESFVYERDLLGRVLYEKSADAGARWSLPDAFDRPAHEWTRGGEVHRERSFDALDRTTEVGVEHEGRARVTERLYYGEGTDGRNARGRLIRHEDGAGVLEVQSYDPFGNVLSRSRRLTRAADEPDWSEDVELEEADRAHVSRFAYDALGRTIEEHLPDGTHRRIGYASSGALNELTVEADGIEHRVVEGGVLNARGQRRELWLGNDVVVHSDYHPETFSLQARYAERERDDKLERVQDLVYTYDPSGRIVHVIDRAQEPGEKLVLTGQTVSSARAYRYDFRYQLITATGRVHGALGSIDYRRDVPVNDTHRGTRRAELARGDLIERYERKYNYDEAGNLRWIDHRTITPNPTTGAHWTADKWISDRSNRSLPATDHNGISLADRGEGLFDASGNCVYLPFVRKIEWNADERPIRAVLIERPGGVDNDERYQYGADARRVRKVSRELKADGIVESTAIVYLDGCELRRVHRDENEIVSRITSHIEDDEGNELATLYRWKKDTFHLETEHPERIRLHYVLRDGAHGSAVLELDARGDVVACEEYFPYGCTAFVAGDAVEVALRTIRFSGKEQDDATGLYYFHYRYYAPFIGNWLSPDPLGPVDSLNLYVFVLGDPINLVDPDGLAVWYPSPESGGGSWTSGQTSASRDFAAKYQLHEQPRPEAPRRPPSARPAPAAPPEPPAPPTDSALVSDEPVAPAPRVIQLEPIVIDVRHVGAAREPSRSSPPFGLPQSPPDDSAIEAAPETFRIQAETLRHGVVDIEIPLGTDPGEAARLRGLALEMERQHAEERGRRIGFGRVLADTITEGTAGEVADFERSYRDRDYAGMARPLLSLSPALIQAEVALSMATSPLETANAAGQALSSAGRAVGDFYNWVLPEPGGGRGLSVRRLSRPDISDRPAEARRRIATERGIGQGTVLGIGVTTAVAPALGFPGHRRNPFPRRSRAGRLASQSAGGGEWAATGVPRFDRLMHGSLELERWRRGLSRQGFTLQELPVSRRRPGLNAEVVPALRSDGSVGGTVWYDPTRFRYIDLLHESRHVMQARRARIGSITRRWRAFFEQGAYEYELRLADRYQFSSEYVRQVRGTLQHEVPRSLELTFRLRARYRDIWR